MNWFHRQVCGSARWRRRLESELLPWALQGVQLGDDVLEIGPGPGATTDLLRGRTQRLTALEVEATAAAALQQRLEGSGVRVIHGDGAAMPFADCSFSGVVSLTMLHHVPTAALRTASWPRCGGCCVWAVSSPASTVSAPLSSG